MLMRSQEKSIFEKIKCHFDLDRLKASKPLLPIMLKKGWAEALQNSKEEIERTLAEDHTLEDFLHLLSRFPILADSAFLDSAKILSEVHFQQLQGLNKELKQHCIGLISRFEESSTLTEMESALDKLFLIPGTEASTIIFDLFKSLPDLLEEYINQVETLLKATQNHDDEVISVYKLTEALATEPTDLDHYLSDDADLKSALNRVYLRYKILFGGTDRLVRYVLTNPSQTNIGHITSRTINYYYSQEMENLDDGSDSDDTERTIYRTLCHDSSKHLDVDEDLIVTKLNRCLRGYEQDACFQDTIVQHYRAIVSQPHYQAHNSNTLMLMKEILSDLGPFSGYLILKDILSSDYYPTELWLGRHDFDLNASSKPDQAFEHFFPNILNSFRGEDLSYSLIAERYKKTALVEILIGDSNQLQPYELLTPKPDKTTRLKMMLDKHDQPQIVVESRFRERLLKSIINRIFLDLDKSIDILTMLTERLVRNKQEPLLREIFNNNRINVLLEYCFSPISDAEFESYIEQLERKPPKSLTFELYTQIVANRRRIVFGILGQLPFETNAKH